MITMIVIILPVDFTQSSHRGYSVGNPSSASIFRELDPTLGPYATKRNETWGLQISWGFKTETTK